MYLSLKTLLRATCAILPCLLLLRCGPGLDGTIVDEGATQKQTTPDETTKTTPASKTVEYRVVVEYESTTEDGLSLTATLPADSYDVSLLGCESGYTQTNKTGTLDPYYFDKHCYVKLNSFSHLGNSYTTGAPGSAFPDLGTAGENYEDFVANANTLFYSAAANGTTEPTLVRVWIETPIPSPVDDGEANDVVFKFSEIKKGTDKTVLKSTIDDTGNTVTVTSVNAPSFSIFSSTLIDITVNGEGVWSVIFECSAGVASTGANTTCNGLKMTDDLKYMLVEDPTFAVADNPTVAELETEWAAGSVITVLTADIVDLGASGTTNGGFKTAAAGITGPIDMHLHPNMILILRSNDPVQTTQYSYQYFNFDVDITTDPI